jgi:hypothetical protein
LVLRHLHHDALGGKAHASVGIAAHPTGLQVAAIFDQTWFRLNRIAPLLVSPLIRTRREPLDYARAGRALVGALACRRQPQDPALPLHLDKQRLSIGLAVNEHRRNHALHLTGCQPQAFGVVRNVAPPTVPTRHPTERAMALATAVVLARTPARRRVQPGASGGD